MGARSKVDRLCVKCGRRVHPFSSPVSISVSGQTFQICEGCAPRYCLHCGVELGLPSGVKLVVGKVELEAIATGVCGRCRGLEMKPFLAGGLAAMAAGVYLLLQGALPAAGGVLCLCGAAACVTGVLGRRRKLDEEDARRLRAEFEETMKEVEE